jgi:pilus assembly protein CpaE
MSVMASRDPIRIPLREGSTGEPLSLVGIGLDRQTSEALDLFASSTALVRVQRPFDDFHVDDHASVLEWLGEPVPDICLLNFDRDRRSAAMLAEQIRSEAPEVAVFAISSQSQPELIIQAMHSGCREYLLKPLDPEKLVQAVVRVGGRRKEKKETGRAQVLAFSGAKGGCGVTTLVTQMGALLANSGSSTLILDLHPAFGDAALYLGFTRFRYHSFELLQNTDRLDPELLQSFVLHHSSGVDLIPSPTGSEPALEIAPGAVAQTIDFLRPRYDFILVDMPAGLNSHNLELMHACDQAYLVTVAEVAALRNVVHESECLSRSDVPGEKVRVVLNRYHKRSPISDADIEKAIKRKLFWKVPNQYAHVVKTINGGDPISHLSNSDVMRSVQEWAEAINGKPEAEEKNRDSQGILSLFSR